MANKLLFNRKYKLTIGPAGGTGRSWDNLRIIFNIEKTSDSTPNKAQIEIYNLNEDSRNFIQEKQTLIFEAGYFEDFGVIFSGTIDKISKERQEVDIITRLESKDGFKALASTYTSKSFNTGTDVKTVIDFLINEMGVKKGTIKDLPNTNFSNGFQIIGNVKRYMDDITKSNGLSWYINDGAINIIKTDEKINDLAIVLDNESGLIKAVPLDKGINLISLLRPGLNPGSFIQYNKKFYIAKNVTHRGDTRSNEYFSEVEVRAA